MLRTTLALLLLALLPGCVAPVGTMPTPPGDAVPLLREKVTAAQRIVELRKKSVEDKRSLYEVGRTGLTEIAGAETLVHEAQTRLIDARVDLLACERGDAVPLLREKVAAAQRIVELHQKNLADVRTLEQTGRVGPTQIAEAEIPVCEAQIRLLDARVELLECESLGGK